MMANFSYSLFDLDLSTLLIIYVPVYNRIREVLLFGHNNLYFLNYLITLAVLTLLRYSPPKTQIYLRLFRMESSLGT